MRNRRSRRSRRNRRRKRRGHRRNRCASCGRPKRAAAGDKYRDAFLEVWDLLEDEGFRPKPEYDPQVGKTGYAFTAGRDVDTKTLEREVKHALRRTSLVKQVRVVHKGTETLGEKYFVGLVDGNVNVSF